MTHRFRGRDRAQATWRMSTQTRGFLFADLRGYSAYTERRGDDAARELLRRYRALVRQVIARHDGAEIRTEGDSFYVVFGSVSAAVLAGLEIQAEATAASAAAPTDPIRVGVGIHAGETTDDAEEGIVSSAVNIAARVCAVAEPGEVLVTDTVRALTRSAMAVDFAPRGRRRLKGIAEPVAVFAAREYSGGDGPRARRRGRAVPSIVAAAVIGAAILAGAAYGVLASRFDGVSGGPSASMSEGASPTGASTPSASSTAEVASPGAAAFPDPAENGLMDRLSASVTHSCRRADVDEVPVYRDAAYQGRPYRNEEGQVRIGYATEVRSVADRSLPIAAGIECLDDSVVVLYWEAHASAQVEEIFLQLVGRRGIQPGECPTPDAAVTTWQLGPHAGRLSCYLTVDGAAVLEWTYGNVPIYAIAVRRDGDLETLYTWWRNTGRLLSR